MSDLIDNWSKSSFSEGTNDCVEKGSNATRIGFRDTKQAGLDEQPAMLVGRQAGAAFLTEVAAGRFDR